MKKVLFCTAVMFIVCTVGVAGARERETLDEVSSFRCGNDLVSVGDSAAEVQLKCGDPYSVQQTGVKGKSKSVTRNVEGNSAGSRLEQKPGKKSTTLRTKGSYDETLQEVWSYNRGPNDFIYNLHFDGGVLKKIEVGGRGR